MPSMLLSMRLRGVSKRSAMWKTPYRYPIKCEAPMNSVLTDIFTSFCPLPIQRLGSNSSNHKNKTPNISQENTPSCIPIAVDGSPPCAHNTATVKAKTTVVVTVGVLRSSCGHDRHPHALQQGNTRLARGWGSGGRIATLPQRDQEGSSRRRGLRPVS